ncbi:DUF2147 domain-containing protein [Bradyrhizobium archetypum]|uniref:DUF2147 domain-containing protein n=1 Tax=Bradyrhizobium archetypum TaxID=2721160 RepID=A0A7Y4HA10_9BRAD|nr:DUF2147 domain-containing protein [Bradyrhizobium archetypum]NOJ50406.1 DUF2147 domain-containing protein [Bradyrhizobium archetypum]
MKKCLAIAALLLASTVTAAQAQYTFEYNGRTITIDPDRGTVSIPGVYDNTGKKKRARGEEGDLDRPSRKVPQQAKTAPQAAPETAPAPAAPPATEQAAAPAAPAPAAPAPSAPAAATATPSTATAAVAPTDAAAPAPAAPVAPQAPQNAAPAIEPPAPVAAPPQPQQKQAAAPAASMAPPANSPIGVWLTEEKEGKVRIEQCGANLCGYSVDKKSNQNGEQVLINMKPGKDKWSGRILDPTTGSTYDSTIALKGTDSLRVQGCAFGGMFCGGQTWTRVN